MKFTKGFKQLHLNLLIQEDPKCLDETRSSSSSDKITVSDPFSEIKSKLKNILITRCGVKMDELSQYCLFDVVPVEEKSISEKLGEAIKDEYQGEKVV
jgi:hypothetical protein